MVVVLLNPGIFKRKDGKGFNLRMNENKTPLSRQQNASVREVEGGESVLEVGFARDWAGCDALRKDGTVCGDWVDTRHSKICAFHVDSQIKRARTNRHEYAVGYLLSFPPLFFHNRILLVLCRYRPFSPKKEKEQRNPF